MSFAKTLLTAAAITLAGPNVWAQDASGEVKNGDQFDDWTFACEALGPGDTRCALTQILQTQEGARILQVTVGRLGNENEMALLAMVPLGVYLPAGVAIKIDEGEQMAMQMLSCTQNGCEAALEVTDDVASAMKKGTSMIIGFKGGPFEETITVPVSLKGITRGMNALDAS